MKVFMKTLFLTPFILFGALNAHAADSHSAPMQSSANEQIIEIKSTSNGFEPSKIDVSSETPVTLKVTRTSEQTCATEIVIKDKKINQKLPLNETVTIELGKLKKGTVKFACAMNMIRGTLHVK